ncbi:polysaccharide pyruvyl transferase family protein [Mucisphaera sp.]|uniref:polysaccharide pyruvyl transferase family protein n=1 Tax=Mucisphaera sp. TaxID=2913024 RepID=UPI003D0F5D21
MQVGIVTIHHTTNYGAVLQAWALSQAVCKLGHQARIIDYRPTAAVNYFRRQNTHNVLALAKFIKDWRFHQFRVKNLRTTERCNESSDLPAIAQRFDAIIAGSDQIWAINKIRGFEPNFFLEFAADNPQVRKLAYAASCGEMTTVQDPQQQERIRKALGTFHTILVRDENTAGFVHNLSHQPADVVLDPTFLGDFSPLHATVRDDNYLLVYAELMPQAQQAIRELARSKSLKIISVGYRFKGADKLLPFAGPQQWFNLIRHASMVITNFYHGGIFSILNRRDFVFLGRPNKMIKTMSLLKNLTLEDRWLDDNEISADRLINFPATNYTPEFEQTISEKTDQSRSRLRQMLD